MQPYLHLLSTFQTKYKMVKDNGRLGGGTFLCDFVGRLDRKKVLTNKGRLGFDEIATLSSKPHLLLYSDPAISEYFRGRGDVMIFGDADLLFELAVFLAYRGAEFHTGFSGYDEFKRFGEPRKLYASEFVHDADYEKLGDSEILYSVIHAVSAVKDGRLRELFLNAARWSKSAEEVAKMRKDVFSLDRQISE
jgi:hypothetical protein